MATRNQQLAFLFSTEERKKFTQVWNNVRGGKYGKIVIFWVNYPFKAVRSTDECFVCVLSVLFHFCLHVKVLK